MTKKSKVLVVGGVVVALVIVTGGVIVATTRGSSGEEKQAAPTSTTTTTVAPTTTTRPLPIAPLTGLPDESGASQTRPAMAVKVENTPDARPQAGLDQADVVYEEVVEGGITRFIAIFNSAIPDVIGPVRSVRAQDPDIMWPIGGIFAYSGGAGDNVNLINNSPVHAVDETSAQSNGAMQRNAPGQPPRGAPHNLYVIGPRLVEQGGNPVPPPALFQYLAKGAPAVDGRPVASTRVGFVAGYDPTYTWDAGSGTWKRSILGQPDVVVGGAQLAPTNVVVQFTNYAGESAAQTVGEGDAWIFTDGTLRMGRWIRTDRTQPARYTDAAGNPLLLRPGRTWVELVPNGSAVDVVDGPPPPTTVPPTTLSPPTTTTTRPKKR